MDIPVVDPAADRLPVPERDVDSEPFWQATKEHRLTYQTCNACNNVIFYPRGHCTSCGSSDLKVNDSKGEGTVYTYSVVRANRSPLFREYVPYTVAFIDLDEGFRMMSNVVDTPPENVKCGMRVKVKWEDEGDIAFPLFAPA